MNPDDPLTSHFHLKPAQQKALARLGVNTIRDLLYHFPHRYGDAASFKNIESLTPDEHAVIFGRVKSIDTDRTQSGMPVARATIADDTGAVKAIWFRQPYIAKKIPEDAFVKVDGTVNEHNGKYSFTNPEIQQVEDVPIAVGNSLFSDEEAGMGLPVYPERRGITSRWMYHALQKIFAAGVHERLSDPLPPELLERYSLPTLSTALVWIHTPKKQSDADAARKRFSFEEIFFIQLSKQKARREYEENPSFVLKKTVDDVREFTDRFPFELTAAQWKAIDQILADFRTPVAMSRLLEGDVGSGKTAVAAVTAHAVVTTQPKGQDYGNLQVGYMAPTEILARQHFETFIELFAHLPIQIGLITSSGCEKFPSKVDPTTSTSISRKKLLEWVKNGEIPILVGTHSLIQKSVEFENLAFVIIDEQHRFGTKQRFELRKKHDILPHLLSMTATPIPRTLALTMYGDLDITLLDQNPKGRKQIITEVVLPEKRDDTYEQIRAEIKNGRQAYVICPRITEPDPENENAVAAKAVETEAERLQEKVFPELTVEKLHGKMGPKEKNAALERFAAGESDILVATSVVEVGVNVPNATMIVIEGAERFGLAQLHQLRGRVMRSHHQPYCFVFTESSSKKTVERLNALTKANNGFELAEYDLAQRGPGELAGRAQSGISDLGMEAIKNLKMVEAAREEARSLVERDSDLENYPHIRGYIDENGVVHEE